MKIPNLQEAAALVDRDSPPRTIMELGEMAEQARSVPSQAPTGGLSPATAEGLRAIKQATEAAMKAKEAEKATQEPAAAEEKPNVVAEQEDSFTARGLDDLELGQLMGRIQQDVLNNTEQRKLIESRLDPIDIKVGIAKGRFEQFVPIVPGVLEVWYRSVTPFENMHIRRMLLEMAEGDPMFETLSIETYTALNVTASIHQLNGERWEEHVDLSSGSPTFNPEILRRKLDRLMLMPIQIVHSVGVHSSWFDSRCREALKVPSLKGG